MAGKEEALSPLMEPESKSVGSEAMGGCGLKRKAEETEEAPAADVVVVDLPESERLALIRQDSSEEEVERLALIRQDSSEEEVVYEGDFDEFDPDEDPETIFDKIKAKLEARFGESAEEVTYEDDSSEEFGPDEDAETIYAKIVAKFDARLRESEALFPGVTYGDCFLEEASNDVVKDELSDEVEEAVPA